MLLFSAIIIFMTYNQPVLAMGNAIIFIQVKITAQLISPY